MQGSRREPKSNWPEFICFLKNDTIVRAFRLIATLRFELSRFAADAIACSKQAASEIRGVHTNRTQASASRVLQNGLSRATMRRS